MITLSVPKRKLKSNYRIKRYINVHKNIATMFEILLKHSKYRYTKNIIKHHLRVPRIHNLLLHVHEYLHHTPRTLHVKGISYLDISRLKQNREAYPIKYPLPSTQILKHTKHLKIRYVNLTETLIKVNIFKHCAYFFLTKQILISTINAFKCNRKYSNI